MLEYNKRYREENKDRTREYTKQYNEANRDLIRWRNRQYRLENLEKYREQGRNSSRKRNAIKNKVIEAFDNDEIQELLDSCNGVCPICGKDGKITLDHIIPLSKAPDWYIYTKDDVQPLCRSCNSSKGNSINEDWIQSHYISDK